MPAENYERDPRLSTWVGVVDYFWQRTAIIESDRLRLRAELQRDLAQSLAEGASVEDLIAVDPAEFAAEVAAADGIKAKRLRPDPEITDRSLVVTVLAGALAGALLALLTVYPLGISALDQSSATQQQQGWVAIGLHVVAACVCVATAMAAVWWRFRFRGRIRRTLVLTGGFLAIGGLASIAPTMALARSLNYSSALPVVLLEIAIVVAFCSVAVLAARRLLTRQTHQTRPA